MSKPIPCPFCKPEKSKPELVEARSPNRPTVFMCYVMCKGCGSCGAAYFYDTRNDDKDTNKAIAKWNKRKGVSQ